MQFQDVISFNLQKKTISNEKNASLLLVKNESEKACCLSGQVAPDEKKTQILGSGEVGFLWSYKTPITLSEGECVNFPVDVMRLAKLQAFIDRVFGVESSKCSREPFFQFFPMPQLKTATSFQEIEYWYMSQVNERDDAHNAVIPFIRFTEWYQLVTFLIEECHSEEANIQQLSEKYGLSSSYFRFLCKQVLGGTLKGQISDWRLANALIDMIKLKLSATDVAYKAGYSSLSHFSKEVKKAMGHSTRNLKKIILS